MISMLVRMEVRIDLSEKCCTHEELFSYRWPESEVTFKSVRATTRILRWSYSD
jgi:hypothetical protein